MGAVENLRNRKRKVRKLQARHHHNKLRRRKTSRGFNPFGVGGQYDGLCHARQAARNDLRAAASRAKLADQEIADSVAPGAVVLVGLMVLAWVLVALWIINKQD